MQDPAFRPRISHTFLNASTKEAPRPNMRHQGAASGSRWPKKWSKPMEDGFGSKAKQRKERPYTLSCASRNQEIQHEGCPPRLHLGNLVLPILLYRVRSMVTSPAVFATILHSRTGRGKISPCVGQKTRGTRPEVC